MGNRIGIVVRRFSARGGLEANVLGLARHLVRAGHHVQVVTQKAELDEPGLEQVLVAMPPALPETIKIGLFARRAAATLAALAPEASITSGHAYGVSVARLEGGLARELQARAPRKFDPAEWAVERVERKKLAAARLILPLSDASARTLRETYGVADERIRVVRNGIDLQHHAVPSEETKKAARAAHADVDRVVAFIGSGFERKGLYELLPALARARGLGRVRLLIAGEDRAMPRFGRLAASLEIDARFLGHVSDVRPLLASADLCVLASRYDPFGLVALEALAAGLPVVVSRGAGASEIVPYPELVVDHCRDAGALARALDRAGALAAEPNTRAVCRAAAERWPIEASFRAVEAALLG